MVLVSYLIPGGNELMGVDRYNPGNLPMMEDYLREQMEQGEQDLLANLAILKL